jgi:chorismate lyase
MLHRARRTKASRWGVHKRCLRSRVPEAVRHSLPDAGSFTDRLRAAYKGCFNARIVKEGWRRPRLVEARALGWVRELPLLCDGEPRVFARAVVPSKTLSGGQRQLAQLYNGPLGALVFADPGMQRTAVEPACIRPGQAMFVQAPEGRQHKPAYIGRRRSVFRVRVHSKPLLVTEMFLRDIGSIS